MAANQSDSETAVSPTVVVKLGGAVAAVPAKLADLIGDVGELVAAGSRVVIVHGGGAEVSALSERLGLKPRMVDGVRQTTAEEMDVVDMVLCGLVNKRVVRACAGAQLSAVGICGSDGHLFAVRRLAGNGVAAADASHTGEVEAVAPALLHHLLDAGYVPVVASPAHLAPDVPMNINADAAALELAPALRAQALLFLSDVAGVLSDGVPVAALTPAAAEAEIARRTITGGMIPKVRAAVGAVTRGVSSVVVGRYEGRHTLQRMLAGRQGTTIHAVADAAAPVRSGRHHTEG